MYINLLLGAVALVAIWLWLRKLLVRDDVLRDAPAAILEREALSRKAGVRLAPEKSEKERLRPVIDALEQMRSALPQVAEGMGAPVRRSFSWDDAEDAVRIWIHEAGNDGDMAVLTVIWREPDGGGPGAYILTRSDTGEEERRNSLDGCVRAMSSFIVDYLE